MVSTPIAFVEPGIATPSSDLIPLHGAPVLQPNGADDVMRGRFPGTFAHPGGRCVAAWVIAVVLRRQVLPAGLPALAVVGVLVRRPRLQRGESEHALVMGTVARDEPRRV